MHWFSVHDGLCAVFQVCGVKLLVKWLLGLKDDQQKSAVPVLRILTSVLENDGDLQGNNNVR